MNKQPLGSANSFTLDHMRISVSYYCNLHCEHCYVPLDYRDQYKSLLEPHQLKIEEMTSFIDMLKEQHSLRMISVTGGEPLLNKVWPRTKAVLEHAEKLGLAVQINTGGLGQVPIQNIATVFKNPEKLTFQFSFDGACAETVDSFRGRKGVYNSALRQMAEAINAGALVQARFTANRHNITEALDAYRLLSTIPITSFKIKPMFAAGVAIDNKEALLGSVDEIRALQESLIAISHDQKTRLELPPPIFVNTSEHENKNVRFIGCNCGVTSGYLSTNGDLYPCSYIVGDTESKEFKIGNIRDTDFNFAKAWLCSPSLAQYKENAGCGTCPTQATLMRNVENKGLACV